MRGLEETMQTPFNGPISVRWPRAGRSSRLIGVLVALALFSVPLSTSAQHATPDAVDELGLPTERGIRLTPAMALTLGGGFARNVLVHRYELDETKVDEAGERIARRMMAAAHANGRQAQALLEFFLAEVAEDDARTREPGHSGTDTFMTPEFCRKLAEHILPMTPIMRELVRDVGQDIRPMLPLKQQLKLGADLTVAGGTLTILEENMQRWADGLAKPGENPFTADNNPGERNAGGESKALQRARESAESELDKKGRITRIWESYLAQTKEFYELDDGQCATADSIFREFIARLENILEDPKWRAGMYRTRLWLSMTGVAIPWQSPLRDMLDRRYQEHMAPINTLGDKFRLRLDQIPTIAQRAAAEARMTEALEAHGYELTTSREAD
jgi:hypothetical protein